MKEVIIKFTPFVLKQTVFIKNEDGTVTEEKVSQKDLANYIFHLKDIKQVHLFGNSNYASKLKEECLTKYKMNDMIININ